MLQKPNIWIVLYLYQNKHESKLNKEILLSDCHLPVLESDNWYNGGINFDNNQNPLQEIEGSRVILFIEI